MAELQTKSKSYFDKGTNNLIEISRGFAFIAFNSATIYISVSIDGTLRYHIEGNLSSYITSLGYANGYIYVEASTGVNLQALLYSPHGKLL